MKKHKIPIIVDNVRFESLAEASEMCGIDESTIWKAHSRAVNDGGSTRVKGHVLKIVGPCSRTVAVDIDRELDTVEVSSGRSSVIIAANLVPSLIEKLSRVKTRLS